VFLVVLAQHAIDEVSYHARQEHHKGIRYTLHQDRM